MLFLHKNWPDTLSIKGGGTRKFVGSLRSPSYCESGKRCPMGDHALR